MWQGGSELRDLRPVPRLLSAARAISGIRSGTNRTSAQAIKNRPPITGGRERGVGLVAPLTSRRRRSQAGPGRSTHVALHRPGLIPTTNRILLPGLVTPGHSPREPPREHSGPRGSRRRSLRPRTRRQRCTRLLLVEHVVQEGASAEPSLPSAQSRGRYHHPVTIDLRLHA